VNDPDKPPHQEKQGFARHAPPPAVRQGKQALLFSEEKRSKKDFCPFVSVRPQPTKPIIPPSASRKGRLLASPVAASPRQTREILFASFSGRQKDDLSLPSLVL
jgi:hypothetical protein